jgi:hypothetical protein
MHWRAVDISRVTLMGASNAGDIDLEGASRKTLSPQCSWTSADPVSRAPSMS